MNKSELIRKIYLYVATLVGLVLIVIGTVRLVDLGLKVYVFKDADTYIYYPAEFRFTKPDGTVEELTPEEQEKAKREQEEVQIKQTASQRQRDASNSIAMLIVGLPVFLYHWRVVGKEK